MTKTPEQIRDEKQTFAFLVIGGFFFPPLWILALFHWLGGGATRRWHPRT